MANLKIQDFYDDGAHFEAILEAASENAWSNWQQETVARVRRGWDDYGMQAYLTPQQNNSLRSMAGVDASIDD